MSRSSPAFQPSANAAELPVVIVDPDRSYAELLADRLQREQVTRTVEVCVQVDQGLSQLSSHPRCLLITEHLLGGCSSFALADPLREKTETMHVVLSRRVGLYTLDRLWKQRVAGCLLKSDSFGEILASLRQVKSGHRVISPALRRELTRVMDAQSLKDGPREKIGFTRRQLQVLVLLAEGIAVKQVALQLHLTEKAVDSMKYRLMKRMNFHDRVELTRFAIREGLIEA